MSLLLSILKGTRTTNLSKEDMERQRELWTIPESGICDGLTTCVCGSKKVTHTDRQLRSGDEGMTVIAHCTACGIRWRLCS